MAIFRDKGPLVEKATGKPVTPPPNPMETPMGRALASRVAPQKSFADFAQVTGLVNDIPATQGLSPKGKYGGFYTAGDLETAITGEALAANEASLQWASDLQRLASERVRTAKQAQQQDWQKVGYQQPGIGPRNLTPEGARDRTAELYRGMSEAQRVSGQYADFYPQINQARQTAELVEDIPVMQYARAIATRKYGMNPALAAGTFGTEFEAEQMQNLRDQQFLDLYGVTEADYRAAEEREYQQSQRDYAAEQRLIAQAKETRAPELLSNPQLQERSAEVRDLFYLQGLEQSIGANPKPILTAAGLTPQQAYNATSQTYNIPETGEQVTYSSELAAVEDLLAQRDFEGAVDRVSRLTYTQAEPVARLLSAYIVNLARIAGRPLKEYSTLTELMDIGLQNPEM